ncbi:glycoside hydrolase family 43 protein [Alkalitalea saponilacus]|uniref:Alpha-N-arabinofuranosidase n=1 Tax=Alkalitalea saponilacus TaxID=889453 RepID=A0A1T5AA80_9BACT|nr:glycoside hydrolase family 43 protein [Alkalitalea saponilacus]SKB31583.1 alpha-N-arabinofuranosidase [Alkalitalea saponilacus]
MRKNFILSFFVLAFAVLHSCTERSNDIAVFEHFRYKGNDALFDKEFDPQNQYLNPVLAGFYPDPSICKKGDTYYVVHSSFSLYPGVPIFKSNDLVNWEQIGHVLDRPSQLELEGLQISNGIFAPAIEYNPYNETFYMITTSTWGIGNFYVKTKDPEQGWSDPIVFPQVRGIDPSVFFDDDGKGYILECAEPMGGADYRGQRAIHMHLLDVENDVIIGEPKEIVRGGARPEDRPIWIEAPHIIKKFGYYYLICAEGGTGLNHSQVVFRSKDVWGPYIPYENNPILTQRDLPEDREDKITTAGHADFVQDENGRWWAVFLGVRPYEFDMTNVGRDTYLLPVEWPEGGWPTILPQGEQIPIVNNKPGLNPDPNIPPTTGNFEFIDNFDSEDLGFTWMHIRTPREKYYNVGSGKLELRPRDITTEEIGNPSAILRRQQHTTFEAETKLEFYPETEADFAGFTLFQNEEYQFLFGKTIVDGKTSLVVNRLEKDKETLATVELTGRDRNRPVYLKVTGDAADYSFLYSMDGKNWVTMVENADGRNLSSRVAGGFIGALIGLYTTNNFEL